MKAIDILKNVIELMEKARDNDPLSITYLEDEIKAYREAIEELEELKHNYEMQVTLIQVYKEELEALKYNIKVAIGEIECSQTIPMYSDTYISNALRYLKEK